MVEFCETPIDEAELVAVRNPIWVLYGTASSSGVTHLAVLVVNHDVVGLDIPVHDALAVAVVECLSGSQKICP